MLFVSLSHLARFVDYVLYWYKVFLGLTECIAPARPCDVVHRRMQIINLPLLYRQYFPCFIHLI